MSILKIWNLMPRVRGARAVAGPLVAGLVCLASFGGLTGSAIASTKTVARAASGYSSCSDPYPSTRNPANPLMLSPAPPAGDPLRGANFFVDGPRHGVAAGAIAHLLGIDRGTGIGHPLPSFKDGESWAWFDQHVVAPRLPGLKPSVALKVRMLEKIASQPEPQRISAYSMGGSPRGIYNQMIKLYCHNFNADPGAIPVINTYFLHGTLHGCPSTGRIDRYRPKFRGQIDSIRRATGNRPVVFTLELDYLGSSGCIASHGALPAWESLMRYEVDTLSTLPHAVLYIEAGYSDANGPAYTARALNRSDLARTEGFYTNDTHLQWTINEVRWGEKISRLTHGAHFIVNTSQNGRGPKLNRHPSTQGVEDLCNAPGRGLGPTLNTHPPYKNVDALMWITIPGNSSGHCGGGPSGGVFWPGRAIGLAERATQTLGPGGLGLASDY